MATVSDITNSMGVPEKATPHAAEADELIDEISRQDVLEESVIGTDDPFLFTEHHKEDSKLPTHLFDSATAREDAYAKLKEAYAKDARLETRYGMTYKPYLAPHTYFQADVPGLPTSYDPMIGSAVSIPPPVVLGKYHPQEWDCGCLHL
jgi:hypothetical protein